MPGEADRHTNFYHGKDANSPEEHVGELSSIHKQLYRLATPLLRTLFFALAKNPRLNPYNPNEKDALDASNELNGMNAVITAENQKKKK
jgi:hypothetical protein